MGFWLSAGRRYRWQLDLLAKLIITGADRSRFQRVLRRALAELTIEGMPTVVPFHRVVLDDPAFAPAEGGDFKVHPLD